MTSEEKMSEILDWVQDALNANWGFMCCLKEDLKDLVAIAQAEHAVVRTKTIKAKPVVRCKDCKHRYDIEHCPMCQEHDYRNEDGDCDYYTVDRTTDNGFCHLAERMEEHAAD